MAGIRPRTIDDVFSVTQKTMTKVIIMFSQSRLYMFFFGALLAIFTVVNARADTNDPPGRAARLSYAEGATSFSPAGENEWVDTMINRPLISGDRLWIDNDGRAEIEVGSSALRLDANTNFELVYLDDRTTQVQVTEGTLDVSLRHVFRGQIFEIDTPTLAVLLDEAGRYRVAVSPDGEHTTVTVMRGSAVARGDDAEYPLREGDRIRFHGTDLRNAEQLHAFAANDFDRFCAARDDRAEHAVSLQYVGIDVVGAYDLDEYGSWSSQRDYGHVWYPNHVDANWAPYRDGHWIWQDPWGWTWVDNARWGFAPAHYGRWVSINHRWGWVPGPRRDRAVYAPALVVFIGGGGFSVGISVGGGGGPIGWFPLGARDVYAPPYRASRDYFTRVNVTNTTINTTNITNIYNNYSTGRPLTQATYSNRMITGAVTAVPTSVFANAQPVRVAAIRVDEKTLASARITQVAAIAPSARSVIGNAPRSRVKPANAVLERKVVAQTPPPPAPVPFAVRQKELQRTPGRPLTPAAIAALRPHAGAAAEARNVRVLGPKAGAINARTAGPAKAPPAVETKTPPGSEAPAREQKRVVPTPPQQERKAPPAKMERATPTPQHEPKAPPAKTEHAMSPPQQERKAPPAKTERAMPTPQQERKAPPAKTERAMPPPQQERKAPPAKTERATPPPQQERKEPPAAKERAMPPPQQERKAPPAKTERAMPPPQQERKAPPAKTEHAMSPPQQERKAPPAKTERATPPPQQERKEPPAKTEHAMSPPQQERKAPPAKTERAVPTPPQQQRNAPPTSQKAKDKEKKDAEKAKKDAEKAKKDDAKKDGGGNLLPPN